VKGHSIAGFSKTRQRIEHDYYATPPESTLALLKREEIIYPALEPNGIHLFLFSREE
jgi:hypothetical protein